MGFFVRCWECNRVGHIDANFHTMRCYNCYGFGHKAQSCASSRRQPMMMPSYTSARKANEPWKKNNAGRIESQKTCAKSQGHSQVWMKNNILLNMNEVYRCKEYRFHVEIQA